MRQGLRPLGIGRVMAFALAALWALPGQAYDVRTKTTGPPVYIKAVEVKLDDDKHPWHGRYGAGLVTAPNFPGSDNYDEDLDLDLKLVWKNKVFFENGTLGVIAFNRRLFRAGFLLRADQGRQVDDLPEALKGLGKVSARVDSGIFAGFSLYKTYITAELLTDISDVTNGQTFDLEIGYTMELSRQTRMVPYFRTKWGSRHHNSAFFDVDAVQAAASGLRQFHAKSGIYENAIGVVVENDLGKDWHFNASVNLARLSDGAKDSPITQSTHGDPNQITLRAKLVKTF